MARKKAAKQRDRRSSRNDELALLAAEGRLFPAAVVRFARDPSTKLHRAFLWDDTRAAQQYRLWQARSLIQQYRIVVQSPDGPREVRALWSLPRDRYNGGGYRRTQDILASDDLLDELIESALADLTRVQERYRAVQALQPIWDAAEQVRERRRSRRASPPQYPQHPAV